MSVNPISGADPPLFISGEPDCIPFTTDDRERVHAAILLSPPSWTTSQILEKMGIRKIRHSDWNELSEWRWKQTLALALDLAETRAPSHASFYTKWDSIGVPWGDRCFK